MTDTLTHQGATELARKITEYWARRGKKVDAFVITGPVFEHKTVYYVRSDMVFLEPERAPQ
jgi:hypothetical protein